MREYLRIFWKRWRLIAVCTLLALGAAAGAIFTMTPQYQASTQLFVSAQSGQTDAGQLAMGGTFTQQRVKSYADIVTSPLVLQPVIEQLGLKTTPAKLARSITADAPVDTVLIEVAVTQTSPALSAAVANAVSTQFTVVVDQLERPTSSSSSPVKVSLVRRASVPEGPTSPRIPMNLALGLLLGLVLGVAVAVLLESLDTSIANPADLEAIGAPSLLAAIVYDPEAGKQPVMENGNGLRGEAFRQLRTNLQFVDVDHPPRTLVVTSSVPGEGKSATTCNLAMTLAHAGSRVVLVEADLRRPTMGSYLGLEPGAGLTTALIGRADVTDLLQPFGPIEVLTCGPIPPNPSELLGSDLMRELLAGLAERFDYVVIDAPPLLPVTDAAVLSKIVDGVIVLVRSGKTRREQLTRALDHLKSVDARILGSVLNMVPSKGRDAYMYGYSYDYRSAEAERGRNKPVAVPVRTRELVTTSQQP